MKAICLILSMLVAGAGAPSQEDASVHWDQAAFKNYISKFPKIHSLDNKSKVKKLCNLAKNELNQLEIDFIQQNIHDLRIEQEMPFFLVPVFQFDVCVNVTCTLLFLEKIHSKERRSLLITFDKQGNLLNYIFSKKMSGKVDEISKTIDQQFHFKSFNQSFQIQKNGMITPVKYNFPKA